MTSSPRSVVRVWPHVAALALLLAGLAVVVVRPYAPDVGAPLEPSDIFVADFLARAAAYRMPVYAMLLAALFLRLALVLTIALSSPGRRMVAAITRRAGGRARGAAAAAVIIVVIVDVVLLPLAFALSYVHDGRFGLRTQSVAAWFADWGLAAVPVWLAVGVVTLLGYWLARRAPRTWPVLAGLSMGVLSLGVAFAAPAVLEPLQYHFAELAPGPLRTQLEVIRDRAGLATTPIVVADASRRSTRQNAYVSGVGPTRRIVLYDTLIAERTPDEVAVVVAHEIGHRRHADVLRTIGLGVAGTLTAVYVLAAVDRRRVRKGLQAESGDPTGVGTVVAVATVLLVLSLPVQQAFSRAAEAAADQAALDLTGDAATMERMQTALAEANLALPQPPAWAQLLWGSHPSTMERITRARQWSEQDGETP